LVPPVLQLSRFSSAETLERIRRATPPPDVVEFHFPAFPTWMETLASETVVTYSTHNVERDYAFTSTWGPLRHRFAARVGRLEQRAISASALVVCCTKQDRARLAELYGARRFAVVPNGFDETETTNNERHREEARRRLGLAPEELVFIFVGGPARHNRRAVDVLEREILPRLRQPARLLVAGACARPGARGRVIALGFVDDLRPALAAADVAVNPVDVGSGSNLKLAEYLAAGLPVVTTPVGLRGYEALADSVTVAELGHFAEAAAASPRGRIARPGMGALSWTALGRRLYEQYAELLAERPTPSAA
jgi:glycosyltransferase involved in cell wall biosynthesis